jgi:hypothetical protein
VDVVLKVKASFYSCGTEQRQERAKQWDILPIITHEELLLGLARESSQTATALGAI